MVKLCAFLPSGFNPALSLRLHMLLAALSDLQAIRRASECITDSDRRYSGICSRACSVYKACAKARMYTVFPLCCIVSRLIKMAAKQLSRSAVKLSKPTASETRAVLSVNDLATVHTAVEAAYAMLKQSAVSGAKFEYPPVRTWVPPLVHLVSVCDCVRLCAPLR